jgi:hypothetical protein
MLIRGAIVITSRQIRAYLEAKPFRPFRLFLSDGSRHEVPHPEFAWVFGSSVFVGVAGNGTRQPDMYVKELSLLHVTRIEKVSARKSK